MKTVCGICPHHCALGEGAKGLCRARINRDGTIISENYGKITSIALDPIEKKPLRRFYPGAKILSVGSYGCNMRCPFCQNCEISMSGGEDLPMNEYTPEELVETALKLVPQGNIGIAYTYNEPLVGYEFVFDCAVLVYRNGLKNVAVTNGMICEEPLKRLLPYFHAFNIDLKAFNEPFYKNAGGDFETVKKSIEIVSKSCHLEVTTLIIPGENDSEEEMDSMARWLSSVNPEIPLHISRFFPRWKMADRPPTPVKTIYKLAETARKHLKTVFEGNC